MIKKLINFFDRNRILLVLTILLLISIIFLSIKSYLFLNHDFKKLECTQHIDDIYCKHNNLTILKDPEKYQIEFFEKNKENINKLKKTFNLREFDFYSAYYYEVASMLSQDKYLYDFFKKYNDTYNLEKFYFKNNLYFEIFYKYKLPSDSTYKKG